MPNRSLLLLVAVLAGAPTVTASANVITDWDEIGVKTVQPVGVPPPINPGLFFRAMAMLRLAMFNAVDAIEPRYQPYKFQINSGVRSRQFAMAILMTIQKQSGCQRGSRLT